MSQVLQCQDQGVDLMGVDCFVDGLLGTGRCMLVRGHPLPVLGENVKVPGIRTLLDLWAAGLMLQKKP